MSESVLRFRAQKFAAISGLLVEKGQEVQSVVVADLAVGAIIRVVVDRETYDVYLLEIAQGEGANFVLLRYASSKPPHDTSSSLHVSKIPEKFSVGETLTYRNREWGELSGPSLAGMILKLEILDPVTDTTRKDSGLWQEKKSDEPDWVLTLKSHAKGVR